MPRHTKHEGHIVFRSVNPYVPLRLRFLVKVVFSEVDVRSKWNFTQSIINIPLFKKLCTVGVATVRSSVRSSVCLFILLSLKKIIKQFYSLVNVLSLWNITQVTMNIFLLKFVSQYVCRSVCSSVRLPTGASTFHGHIFLFITRILFILIYVN